MLHTMKPQVLIICEAVREAGGRALLVGGSVRDLLLRVASKDLDLEVYGLEPVRLRELLQTIGRVNTVGESFTVYKVVLGDPRVEVDVSIPRRESKSGRGHRGFTVQGDPNMSFEEAARRRDFTVNAVMMDPLTGETLDPFGGRRDLEARLLRAVAPETFVEDSLRVLRAMQMAARFEMTVEPATVKLCRSIDLSDLPRERVWGEFEKLLTKAEWPSIGLSVARDVGVLVKLFPEIHALVGCPQDPLAHPEGDAFTHTQLCLDQAAQVAEDLSTEKRITLLLAALCHDLGKPILDELGEDPASGADHSQAGVGPTKKVLDKLGVYTLSGYDSRNQVLALVREHLTPERFFGERKSLTDGSIRRLSQRVDPDLLYRLARANGLSRGSASSSEAADWFIEKARALGVEHGPPEPILLGRHLIETGVEPGPRMGEILRAVYELQLDGQVATLDEALAAATNLKRES